MENADNNLTTSQPQMMRMHRRYVDIRLEEGNSPDLFQTRVNTYLVLLLIRRGQCCYVFGKQRVPVREGDILLIAPGISYRMEPLPADHPGCSRLALLLGPESLPTLEEFRRIALGGTAADSFYLVFPADTQQEYLRHYFEKIYTDAQQQQMGWEAVLYGNAFTMIGLIIRALYETNQQPMEQEDLLDQIIRYVGSNLDRKITLADTARHFLVSESYISKLFRSRLDISFYRYVTRMRMLTAVEMIANGSPLEQIHSQIGFSDHAAFYRAFRKEYGVSPSQYRAEHSGT